MESDKKQTQQFRLRDIVFFKILQGRKPAPVHTIGNKQRGYVRRGRKHESSQSEKWTHKYMHPL